VITIQNFYTPFSASYKLFSKLCLICFKKSAEILQSFADILQSPNPAVPHLEINWASGEGEEPDWKKKELGGKVEEKERKENLEQEPYYLRRCQRARRSHKAR
jgi:hypothetical protein